MSTGIVNEKLESEKSMAEKFQEKVAGIINKHDIVLNNLKEEHSSTLEDLANNNLTLYAPIPQNSQTH